MMPTDPKTKKYTQAEVFEMLRTSPSLQRAQQLAEGVMAILAATQTTMQIGMLAFAHLLVDPLSRCDAPPGPDGQPDQAKTFMLYNLPHERILREALQLYLAKQSAIVGAKDHGVDLLEAPPKDTPGQCIGCGTAVSANKMRCKACADKDGEMPEKDHPEVVQ